MKDVIAYEDYIGSVRYSIDDRDFFGKIEGIDDLVTFEGQNVPQLNRAFREAIHDYIEITRIFFK